jgi:hypothetical protein
MSLTIAGDIRAVYDLISWSDTRDAEQRARFAAEAAAQHRGFAAGFEAGRRAALEAIAEQHRQIARDLAGLLTSPTFAEMDRRRYPPYGRRSWLLAGVGSVYAEWQAYALGGAEAAS